MGETKATIDAQIDLLSPDNNSEEVTPLDNRTLFKLLSDGAALKQDTAIITGAWDFQVTVSGITPTLDAHLSTKKYVDDNAGVGAGDVSFTGDTPIVNEIPKFGSFDGKTIISSGVRIGGAGALKSLGNLEFRTATRKIAGIEVRNLTDLSANNTFVGDNVFDLNITIPVLPLADTDGASKKYVDDNIGSGTVSSTGTPVDDQLAIWTAAGVIEGDPNLTWDGAIFSIGGTFSPDALEVDNIFIDGNDISTTEGELTFSPFTDCNFNANDIIGVANLAVATAITASTVNGISLTALGSVANVLSEAGTYVSLAGGGDVVKVGTPVNNQLGVWTGDGTIEGSANLIWDGSLLTIVGNITAPNVIATTSDTTGLVGFEAENTSIGAGKLTVGQTGSGFAGNRYGGALKDNNLIEYDGGDATAALILGTISQNKILFGTDSNGAMEISATTQDVDIFNDLIVGGLVTAGLSIGSPTILTIASGVVTIGKGSRYYIAGEGGVADSLLTINGGTSGKIIYLQPSDSAVDITIDHGGGNIRMNLVGADFIMNHKRDLTAFMYDDDLSEWLSYSVSSNQV